jgi:predicted alpha/beta hydrolase
VAEPKHAEVHRTELTVPADDRYRLAATLFASSATAANAPITIIAGATGVPRTYYARFATYLAEHWRLALTFDYRGIGGSLTGPIRQSPARFRDWGILDTPGILAWAAATYPGRPIHWVGQSYGGFATGLAHNNHLVARQLGVSTMTADYRYITSPVERAKVAGLLFVAGPAIARACGYLPGWINGGADLPKGVLLEWSAWVKTRGFLFGIADLPEQRHFKTLKAPLCLAFMEDDPWISRAGVECLAQSYTGATERTLWPVTVAESGAGSIGHIGFFRSEFKDTLWPKARAWLDQGSHNANAPGATDERNRN